MKTIISVSAEDFGILCICAIRYCQGRKTYMPDMVRAIIRPLLNRICDRDLNVMIEDCDFQRRMKLYGDDRIDKPAWLQWEQELLAEKAGRSKSQKGERSE